MSSVLTPEEWGDGEFETRFGNARATVYVDHKTRIFVHNNNEVCILPTDAAPKLAALCLHGQPFGFTHDDVAMLRRYTQMLKGLSVAPVAAFTDHTDARIVTGLNGMIGRLGDDFENLASRIANLLPPEAK